MGSIEQNICDAIEVITNNIVSKAGFDKTIQATIVSCIDEATGRYKVKYQDNTFYAYSSNIEQKYSKGNRIYVLIPGNDMTRDKTILGTVGQSSEYKSTEAGTVYHQVSTNLIELQNRNGYKIYSGTQYNYNEDNKQAEPYTRYGKVIYNYGDQGDLNLLKEEVVKEYVNNTGFLWVQAIFQTDFAEKIFQGNYGIRVTLLCGEGEITYPYTVLLDLSHGITGDFYNLFTPQTKYYVMPKPDNFIRIQRIEIFAQNFVTQLDNNVVTESEVTDEQFDIFVKNIGIYAANSVNYSNTFNGINIISPKGIILLEKTNPPTLPIQAEVVEQGNIMNTDSNQFYWFKKDASVNSLSHNKYNNLGGLGWRCLNRQREDGSWEAASNSFDFNEDEHLTIYENNFKVVSHRIVGNTPVKHEKEFKLFNDKKHIEITISYNRRRNILDRTIKDLKLICNVNPPETGVIYKYYWEANVDNIKWSNHTDISRDFGCTFEGNSIKNIKLNNISSSHKFIEFTCTVIKVFNNQETILGTKTVYFVIEDLLSNPYTLILENGDKTFNYDENGYAPTWNGTYVPEPLTIKLINNSEGKEINVQEEIANGNLTIEWDIENKDFTLIDIIGKTGEVSVTTDITQVYYTILEYTLKSPYIYDNLDSNNIKVIVKYDGLTLTETTNFKFLKQGDSGTNGTQYTARIVPKIDSDKQIPRWIIFTTQGGDTGTFNFCPPGRNDYYSLTNTTCIGDGSDDFPFEVQLFRNGQIIYKGNLSQQGIDGDAKTCEVKVKWSMEVKTYDNSHKDKSNYAIVTSNNMLTMKYIKTMYNSYNGFNNSSFDLEHTPANILKCTISYKPKSIDGTAVEKVADDYINVYATLPIVTVVNADNIDFNFDIDSGYNEVVYNRDACNPQYNLTKRLFKINVDTPCDVTNYKWYIKGFTELKLKSNSKYEYIFADNLTFNPDTYRNYVLSQEVLPVYKFLGDSVTNAVLFTYNNSYIHIPIDLHLNRFGLAMLNNWDGQSIEINNDGGFILAPQIGAGKKDNDNKFTGVVMGEAKEDAQKDMHPGLFAYNKSERTFSLMADSGLCAIGKRGNSQIIIDPTADRGCIYSGNFFTQKALDQETGFVKSEILRNLWNRYVDHRTNIAVGEYIGNRGMLIDFSEGHIYFANGRFHLDPDGHMICLEGHLANKPEEFYDFANHRLRRVGQYTENFFVDLNDNKATWSQDEQYDYFLYCRPKNGEMTFSVNKNGFLFSNKGEIGGFKINATNFTSYEHINKPFDRNNRSVITLSNVGFSREGMNVVNAENAFQYGQVLGTSEYGDAVTISIGSSQNSLLRNLNIRRNQTLHNLLFAIGDDFSVDENGILHARESYIQNGLFCNLGSNNFTAVNADIQENLYVKEDLRVGGNALVEGNMIIEGKLIVKGPVEFMNNVDVDGDFHVYRGIYVDGCVSGTYNSYLRVSSGGVYGPYNSAEFETIINGTRRSDYSDIIGGGGSSGGGNYSGGGSYYDDWDIIPDVPYHE